MSPRSFLNVLTAGCLCAFGATGCSTGDVKTEPEPGDAIAPFAPSDPEDSGAAKPTGETTGDRYSSTLNTADGRESRARSELSIVEHECGAAPGMEWQTTGLLPTGEYLFIKVLRFAVDPWSARTVHVDLANLPSKDVAEITVLIAPAPEALPSLRFTSGTLDAAFDHGRITGTLNTSEGPGPINISGNVGVMCDSCQEELDTGHGTTDVDFSSDLCAGFRDLHE